MKPLFTVLLALALSLLMPLEAMAQLPQVEDDHVEALLVSQLDAVVPGQPLMVAVRLLHEDNWHSYWKNPGDAGMPTTIAWSLPEGVSAGEILWPVPRRFDLPADLVDFGYEGEIFLVTELDIPASWAGESFDLSAEVRWLECEDALCIPNGALVELQLPVSASPAPTTWAQGISGTLAQQPRTDVALDATFTLVEGSISLLVQATEDIFGDADRVTFIPGEHRVFDYLDEQVLGWQTSTLQLSQGHHRRLADNLPEVITGLLLVESGDDRQVFGINAAAQNIDLSQLESLPGAPVQIPSLSLAMVFLFALAGGLILNLMPCVLPVLSLKVISVVESAGTTRHEQKLHALVYTAGVIASFLVLASVLLALQSGGAAIGWGFHMQSPVFVSMLAGLFLIMGLSMSGFLEVGTSWMGIGSNLSMQSGYRGSFFTGVLTCVVASPCIAPFMGAALAVALTQPTLVSLTIFASLGLGVALPFLLIAYVPALAALMPRPGQWMVTFKHVMALPLYGALVWMLWVLQQQAGNQGMVAVLAVTLILAGGLWMMQRGNMISALSRLKSAGRIVTAGALVAAVALTQTSLLESRALETDYGFAEPFSEARLAALREQGTPVFVNMTASWCIPCLVNEKVALGSAAFEQALEAKGVFYLKGDWTNNDPEITAVLKRYNTSGVPLYLMFPQGAGAQPEILPQILTEGILLDALDRI